MKFSINIFFLLAITILVLFGREALLEREKTAESEPGGDVPALNDGEGSRAHIENHNDRRALWMPEPLQEKSGIRGGEPEQMIYHQELAAQGEVIEIQSLLELRSSYNRVSAELDVAKAAFKVSEQSLERLKLLHKEAGNISTRQLQDAEAKRDEDQARVRSARMQMQDLHDRAVYSWGEILAAWAFDPQSPEFNSFIKRDEVLLLVTLGVNQDLPGDVKSIYVQKDGKRSLARQAYLISSAPRTSTIVQGASYFFRTRSDQLRIGMRVHAWVPMANHDLSGVVIPASAMVWYNGKPWLYVRRDGEYFIRLAINGFKKIKTGWFVEEMSLTDEWVVSSGSQMLLSEEFRRQIPDEDDNP
ncbi:MAG: hypothetical protein ACE5GZ_11185 [Gammaproteobacteria bacterium]